MMKFKLLIFILLSAISCNNSKKTNMDECSFTNEFLKEVKNNDKLNYSQVIDTYFLKKSKELPVDILKAYSQKLSSIKNTKIEDIDCTIRKDGKYKIIELKTSKYKFLLRLIKRNNSFVISGFIPMMKGDIIIGWI